MIARINHEHAEREKLEQARQELLKRKQALIAENKKRKDDLANLDQDLEKFIDVWDAIVFFCSGVANLLPGCQTYPKDFREGILDIALRTKWKARGAFNTDRYRRSWTIYPLILSFKLFLRSNHTGWSRF